MPNSQNVKDNLIQVEDFANLMSEQGYDDALEALKKYGFLSKNFIIKLERKDVYVFAARVIYSDKVNKSLPNDFLIIDMATKYFWFRKITPILMEALSDVIPYWKADSFSREFKLTSRLTGKDNGNAVKLKDFSTLIKQLSSEIDKLTGAHMEKHPSWFAENFLLYQDMLKAVTTTVSPEMKTRLVSSSLFIEQGFAYQDCVMFNDNNVLYKDVEESGFGFELPAEWLIEVLKKD